MVLSNEQRAALAARLRGARREVAPEATAGDGTCRLVELTPDSGRPALFALHAVGGSVYAYAHLARELAERYHFIGIEAAGLVPDTTPAVTLPEMVANYVRAIRSSRPTGPYRLLGWSMGGMIAFEVARSLEAQGERVSLLGLIDTPFCIDPRTLNSPEALEALFTSDVASILGWDQAPDGVDRREWLAVRLDAGAGRIEEARAEIARRFAVLKANAQLINGYQPRDPIAAAACMVSAAESPASAHDWKRFVARLDLLTLPADHYALLRPPHVRRLAQALAESEPAGHSEQPLRSGQAAQNVP